MEYIALAISLINLILVAICLAVTLKKKKSSVQLSEADKREIIEGFSQNLSLISKTMAESQAATNKTTSDFLQTFQANMLNGQQALDGRVMELMRQIDGRIAEMGRQQEAKLEQLRQSVQTQLTKLQADNAAQLEKIRGTVDEKLTHSINEKFEQSFKVLSTQLENVYKSLGEMRAVAGNVSNLTKVLSNVKTTGIFGEVQLGAILEQMLAREQYAQNIVTGSGREPVEYAVKLPGQSDGEYVYLPIDSKFPLTVYTDLYNAYENGDAEQVKQKREQLKSTVRGMARDIKNKYIYPPKTTNFAVMFLPAEGLYAEVAKLGLIEELQRTYNVTVAGPTTMSALLNSYQMGFRTLAIQKKSGEVWKILGAVKTEFAKYNELAAKIGQKLENASRDFDTLVGTRGRIMENKLKTVESLGKADSRETLGLPPSSSENDSD